MLTKYYIAIDTKETNSQGKKLLLPIAPPCRTLTELSQVLKISAIYLRRLVNGRVSVPKYDIDIEIVYLNGRKI